MSVKKYIDYYANGTLLRSREITKNTEQEQTISLDAVQGILQQMKEKNLIKSWRIEITLFGME